MRKFAWTRMLSVLLVLCMLVSFVSMGIPAVLAERVTIGDDTLEYFPVTMYNYDAGKMNALTHKADIVAGLGDTWEGLYFSGGDPASASYSDDVVNVTYSDDYAVLEDGAYLIYSSGNGCFMTGSTTSKSPWGTTAVVGNRAANEAGTFTITSVGDNKYTVTNSNGGYLDITASNTATFSTSVNYVYFMKSGNDLVIRDYNNSTMYLNALGGDTYFGGYTSGSPITLYREGATITETLPFADYNHWDKSAADKQNAFGQTMWTGLVASQLDANKDIVFTVPDAGLFSDTAFDGKDIYTGVQLPFVYDNSTKYYTFDSATHGVYWHTDSTQGTSSTIASNTKLFWDKEDPQGWSNMKYGDGSSNLWAPFNDGDPAGENYVDYYFGMNATIPFTMTANGRLNASDDTSAAIEYSFSGDDDVWIFIDGKLVVDLGGIHNRLDVTINFASNTVVYSVSNSADGDGNGEIDATGSYNNESFALTQQLFNTTTTTDGTATTTTGLLGTDLATFAATDNHELTIFYMERGGGSSNARIKFNLPVKDTVTVKKVIDEQVVVNDDNTITKSALSAEYQTVVDNLSFEFIMMKNGAPLANTTYNLLNANGQIIANPSTDANGKFTLKNGQTAKFTGEFTSQTNGDTYQVIELIKDGFIHTEFSATKSQSTTLVGDDAELTTDTYTYYEKTSNGLYTITDKGYNGGAAGQLYSTAYTVYGTGETEDSLAFVCENYLNASLPTPSAIPNDDKFVLDYGLSAELEIFSNDLYIGENPTISIDISGLKYGTATYNSATKTVTYTPTAQMTGVEKIPYTLTVSATGADDATGTAYIYIIPATSMYYEENFGTADELFVDYNDGKSEEGWEQVGTPQTDKQEPGKVGTVSDSPYGSDAAYLTDSGDSNGSSMYVSTEKGAAQFTYSFTGTGTSFYVRTNNNSGYMRVVVKDSAGETIQAIYRDTYYETTDGDTTLYNIPVFTTDGLHYGTYTVTVTIAKKTVKNGNTIYHNEFWLDGIRVYNPLDPSDANYTVANAAYAADEEAGMTVVTLRNGLISTMEYEEVTRTVQVLKLDENGDPIEKYDEEGNFIGYVVIETEEIVSVPVWPNDGTFVLFTDTNGEITTADEYVSIGPKEEVYLNDGQTVTFSLADWDPNAYDIYLGIKAPMGSGTVEIGSTQLTISNAADCYYNITNYGTITENEDGTKIVTFDITAIDGLISLTNIKVTGDAKFVVIANTDIDVDGAENT